MSQPFASTNGSLPGGSTAAPGSDPSAPPPPPAPTFDAIPLSADVRKAIDALGYVNPTPVQLAVFEPATRGKSLVVQARTGTGKTAAFGLPIIDALIKKSQANVQALILTPTRELALQVSRELEQLGKFRGTKIVAIYGGAPMGKQIEALEGGAQVVVGTPGRVLDHCRRGTLDTKNIRIFVLDEADEMLSMGFSKELNAIIEHLPPGERQGLYFSATIPPDVERLANKHLKDPEYVTLSSDQVGALQLAHFVYLVREGDKRSAILNIIEVEDPQSAVVFCNTKDETERVAELLKSRGYDADWLNGDLEQKERERVMSATREGKLRFLVATDVAARGIDISHLTHVINADFPESAEQYVHRTGRTGRAGRTGTAISVVGPKDVGHLYMLRLTYKIRPIERMLPTKGEIKTRAEADMVSFLAEAYAGRTADPMHVSVARRLFTHEQAEQIVAGLLADHLGANAATDPAQDAAEARRAKNPPVIIERPAPAPAPVARDARGDRDRGPRREDRPRDDRPRDDRPRDDRPREDRPRDDRPRDDRPRNDRPRDDRPRDDRRDAPRVAAAGAPPREAPRTLRDGERPGEGRPRGRGGENGPRAAERMHGQGVPRDQGMGERGPARADAPRVDRDRAREAGREGIPQATLTDWEPPADDDDDHPILNAGTGSAIPRGRRSATARSAPVSMEDAATVVGLPDEAGAVTGRPRDARPLDDDDAVDTDRHPRLPRLPGITEEGAPAAVPRPPRRDARPPRGDHDARPPREGRDRAPRAERPRDGREGERPQPDARDDASLSNIFLNVGKRDGVNPEDLQKLLADAAGIPQSETGNIRVRDRITFVTVKKELADRAIQALGGQVFGGRTVVAEPARDKAQ